MPVLCLVVANLGHPLVLFGRETWTRLFIARNVCPVNHCLKSSGLPRR